MNRKLQLGLCGGVLGAAACFVGFWVTGATGEEEPAQPVQYNHHVHAEQVGIDCAGCHQGAETRQRAGFPPDAFCLACHSAPQSESANEAKLIDLLGAGTPLAWRQVTVIADHVLFSHQRHVGVGGIDCTTCHGDMRGRTVPITEPAVRFNGRAGMFRCIGCHVESGSPYAGVECLDCHR